MWSYDLPPLACDLHGPARGVIYFSGWKLATPAAFETPPKKKWEYQTSECWDKFSCCQNGCLWAPVRPGKHSAQKTREKPSVFPRTFHCLPVRNLTCPNGLVLLWNSTPLHAPPLVEKTFPLKLTIDLCEHITTTRELNHETAPLALSLPDTESTEAACNIKINYYFYGLVELPPSVIYLLRRRLLAHTRTQKPIMAWMWTNTATTRGRIFFSFVKKLDDGWFPREADLAENNTAL